MKLFRLKLAAKVGNLYPNISNFGYSKISLGIVLQCNNYEIIDLGVMVSCEKILKVAKEMECLDYHLPLY